MNKALFAKVKEKTKDTRLSEKYLTAITEKLGGSVEDDSTDEELIEKTATLIADVATESQGEATRWAQKAKGKPSDNSDDERIAKLQKEIDEMKAERTRGARKAEIDSAFEKHGIPSFLRDRLAKSIADDEDVEAAVSTLKQDCITNGLISGAAAGAKAASEKQVDEAADALLKEITAK